MVKTAIYVYTQEPNIRENAPILAESSRPNAKRYEIIRDDKTYFLIHAVVVSVAQHTISDVYITPKHEIRGADAV